MFEALSSMTDLHLFLLLSFGTIFISIVSLFLVKRYISFELRYKDNPVIGNISSLVSIIYGVLTGITALYLINNISYVDDAVQHEAYSVANVYRDSLWLKEPTRGHIEKSIIGYLQEVIQSEWPAMKAGRPVPTKGIVTINQIERELRQYAITTPSETLIVGNMVSEVRNLYNARQQRVHLSFSSLSSEMWVVILIGTILTIAINYLFGMHFILQLFTVSAVALMASSMIFLMLTLDRPFRGEFVIEPDTFKYILNAIEDHIKEPHSSTSLVP